jgi:hypothetical protein
MVVVAVDGMVDGMVGLGFGVVVGGWLGSWYVEASLSSSSSGRAVLAMELCFLRWLWGVAAKGAGADLGRLGTGMMASSSLESSKRLRKPEETPPPPPSSSLESANRLEVLFLGALESLFLPPPYERPKLGMRMPDDVFFPAGALRSVVRIWVPGGEPVLAGDRDLSENLLKERLSS